MRKEVEKVMKTEIYVCDICGKEVIRDLSRDYVIVTGYDLHESCAIEIVEKYLAALPDKETR